jgi:hypothetical protein
MLRPDPREAELGACLLLRSRTSAQATGRTRLPPRREVRPQRLRNLARTHSRAPLLNRELRLDAGESMVGFTPQDPKSQRALRFRKRLCRKGTVVLVEVGRLPQGERRREPKALWLWWNGPGEPDLDQLWRSYCRRFSVEHEIRFLKQALGWTAPHVRHPEQADRWTWLVLAAYAQLRLARGLVADRRLPWERPLPTEKLTPYRVLRSFVTLLPLVGTPVAAPKPRGRSPGRPRGSRSGRAKRYPAVRKAA